MRKGKFAVQAAKAGTGPAGQFQNLLDWIEPMLISDFNDGRGKVKANLKTARKVFLRKTRQLSKIYSLSAGAMTVLIRPQNAFFLLAYACTATLIFSFVPLGKRGPGGT
jgi:hypothetical protein